MSKIKDTILNYKNEFSKKKVTFFNHDCSEEEGDEEERSLLPGDLKVSYSSINGDNSSEFINQSLYENSTSYLEGLNQNNQEFLSNNYESLDYDKIYNMIDLNKEPKSANREFVKNLSRWIVMFLVGICTGLVGVAVDILVETFSKIKYSLIAETITECTSKGCLWKPLVIWISSNIGFTLISLMLVLFLAPASRGSGIPMVKCYLNGVKIPKVIRIKALISKVLGISSAVLGGLACGKEGPMIHSGAIIAAGISQGSSSSLGFDLKIFKYFRSDTEKRDFVSGGAAAGVSAAFGAPVGGVLFSLEEGASFWNQSLTWRIFFGSMVSTFTLNIFLSIINGKFGDMSNPGLINFGRFQNTTYTWFELPIFILMGSFGGLIGALFNYLNIKLTKFRNRYVKNNLSNIAEGLIVASVSATVGFLLSFYISKDCQPIGRDLVSKYPVQLFCDDGQYNAMSGLFFQTPENSLRSLFHNPPGSFNPITLSIFCVVYYLLAVWTYGLAIPGGLFIPSLLIGAAWGRLLGLGMSRKFPNLHIDPGKYALIGAASTLAGVLRMTLSLTVILTEATGDISLGLPIMFSVLAAKLTGDLFNEGIFDMHIQLSGIPLLDWDPPATTEKLNIQDVMTHPVIVFREKETVGRILEVLNETKHNGYPIVDDSIDSSNGHFGLLKGLILRHQLITLLKRKCFLNNDVKLLPKDFREYYPRYIDIKDIQIDEDYMKLELDLRSYMNLAPYSLTEDSNLPRVFRLFRGLGLRHLIIVDKNNNVVGIVTRIDLARYRAHVGLKNTTVTELSVTR
ncbi:unnamed protein product [Brachionus calyciflorus]|uniref:Chloride channel protein n=1 Tax=Brachionus calyciflorus TaxID=104777 RepID=A0A813SD49_9BILA|nr:unnamed protein product [Brachionus calyciflorus]